MKIDILMSNSNLNKAKKVKNDEFYTQYKDIEKEMVHYKEHLKDKWIYSPCDDYRWSEFKNYFVTNFKELGLRHYTCTCYDIGDGAYRYDYDGTNETITPLNENGDFRSEECIELLKECDVVVTNPPFSLFREYVAQLMEYEKKFLVIGPQNAVTYKEIFPLLKDNKIWWGTDCVRWFIVSEEMNKTTKVNYNGETIAEGDRSRWFTNIPHTKRNEELDLFKKYNETDYPKYDNYDAIEVSRVENIPMDYDGVMGVPITFLDKYCRTQFEIVGILNPYINNKALYRRLLIKKLSTPNNDGTGNC